MSSLSDLSLTTLAGRALDEARADDGESPVPYLIELQSRATEEVLALALAWATTSTDPDERALGIDVLRELGPADDDGRRPFGERVIPRLLALLRSEDDPSVERGLLQALAFNGATEALGDFLERLDHPDDGVRTTVAFQLPYLTNADAPDERVLAALEHLTGDADADVRYYALYALVEEDGLVIDATRALDVARRLLDDPDPRVRELARTRTGDH